MSADDPILLAALAARGHEVFHWCWDDPQVDWESVEVALVRSTWDYFTRMPEFLAWLEVTRTKLRFVNDAEILAWNIDKHYLLELSQAGLSVIPTQIVSEEGLEGAVESLWQKGESAIVKPVVSGGSWGLHHWQPGDSIEVDSAQGPWLVQPFVPTIAEEGELSVILLGGKVSHGIRKTPKSGDIRVQREFGGNEVVEEPSEEACALAHAVLQACPGSPLYARADMVQYLGRYALMEMELLEPELFLTLEPEAADTLASLF